EHRESDDLVPHSELRTPHSGLLTHLLTYSQTHRINRFPLIILVDDSAFTAQSLANFLWITFTRSNPAVDIDGFGPFIENKHWGCPGPLVIDARLKPHHAQPVEPDPQVARRVDPLFQSGGPLARFG